MASQLAERPAARQLTAGRGRGPGGKTAARRPGSCPVAGCSAAIDPSRLMCRTHWYLVPRNLRDLVWVTWRSGEGALSSKHFQAIEQAIAAL
jgi:hypothetical protein